MVSIIKDALRRLRFPLHYVLIAIFAVLLVFGAALRLTEKDPPEQLSSAADVQSDIKRISEAFYNGDIETVLALIHPKLIERLGGTQATRAELQQIQKDMVAVGMKVESFVFPSPPEFLQGGGQNFVVVPTLTTYSAKGTRVEFLGFQVGVFDPDSASWKYIDGSKLYPKSIQDYFPKFPPDYRLPNSHRKIL